MVEAFAHWIVLHQWRRRASGGGAELNPILASRTLNDASIGRLGS